MTLTKFASAGIQEVRFSPVRIQPSDFSKIGSFEDYRTDDGYLYTRVRAISSRVNKNFDGWPSQELANGYKTFMGKPIFVDHNNSDYTRARGVVVDASIHILDDIKKAASVDSYYETAPDNHKPPTWIELLLETDARKFPRLASEIITGGIDGVSMGCNVESSTCSICGNRASSPDEYCHHVHHKGAHFDSYDHSGKKTSKLAYEDCHDIGFFEISYVFDPADETALIQDVRTSKTAHATRNYWANAVNLLKKSVNTSPVEDIHRDAEQYLEEMEELGVNREPGDRERAINLVMGEGADDTTPQYDWDNDPDNPLRHSSFLRSLSSWRKKGEENVPRFMQDKVPDPVDTLRIEKSCPQCGSDMENGLCAVCNYEEPPEGMQNPDLDKARQNVEQMQEMMGPEAPVDPMAGAAGPPPGMSPDMMGQQAPPGAMVAANTRKRTDTDSVNSGWMLLVASKTKVSVINKIEKPILAPKRVMTDRPLNQQNLKDYKKPVQSNTNGRNMSKVLPTYEEIAKKLIQAKIASNEAEVKNLLSERGFPVLLSRVADSLTKIAEATTVPVDAIGGFAGNPEAGTTHAEVDGLGAAITTDPEASAVQESVDKTVEDTTGTPTATWPNEGQQSPVTPDVAKGHSEFNVSHQKTADGIFPGDDASAEKSINLDKPIGNEEVGDPTKTWGTDSFHTTDPITNDPFPAVADAVKAARTHMLAAFKVAEEAVEVGLVAPEDKYKTIAEYEQQSPDELAARMDMISKMRSASGAAKVARRRMPVLASAPKEATSVSDDAAGLFS